MSEKVSIERADCLNLPLANASVDLVFTSPPYEDARTYDIDFKLKGEAWVEWATGGFIECLRVCRGLVCWVVEGRTRNYRYSAAPILFMADLHHRGVHLRKPPIYRRVGIPGSGGPDWVRNDYEFIVCGTNGGKLPWSDNTALGHPPKYVPGGELSYRMPSGRRVNRLHTKRTKHGMEKQGYVPPRLANPGNVIHCQVGGGRIGHKFAHENEAPFPEQLVEFFVRSFCPPGGTVLDPMCGSGTTLAVAKQHGRNAIGFDIRQSQVELSRRRVRDLRYDDIRAPAGN